MRNSLLPILLLIICCWGRQGLAQNTDATAFYNKAMANIKPAYRNLVTQTALQMKGRNVSQDSLVRAFTANKSLKGLNGMDIDALVQLVMMQVSQDTQSDLNKLMVQMKANNQQKQAQRSMLSTIKGRQALKDTMNKAVLNQKKDQASGKKDEISEMSEMDQLRMQQLMDRRNKLELLISNMMKKISSTSDQVISNLK